MPVVKKTLLESYFSVRINMPIFTYFLRNSMVHHARLMQFWIDWCPTKSPWFWKINHNVFQSETHSIKGTLSLEIRPLLKDSSDKHISRFSIYVNIRLLLAIMRIFETTRAKHLWRIYNHSKLHHWSTTSIN